MTGGLHLPFWNRLHSGPNDLRHIGAGKEGQGPDAADVAAEIENRAEEKIGDKNLDQERRAANTFDVDERQAAEW